MKPRSRFTLALVALSAVLATLGNAPPRAGAACARCRTGRGGERSRNRTRRLRLPCGRDRNCARGAGCGLCRGQGRCCRDRRAGREARTLRASADLRRSRRRYRDLRPDRFDPHSQSPRVMSVPCYIGDEVSAAGFRLAGARAIVPSAGDEAAALASARQSATLILIRRRRYPHFDARSRVCPGSICTAHACRPGSQGGDPDDRSRSATPPATRTRGCRMTLESRMHALLDIVEADRKSRCDAITGDARARAADDHRGGTRRSAWPHAGHLRGGADDDPKRAFPAARARLATHRRLHEQRRAGDLLAAGWRKLPAALCDRWREPELRQPWIANVIAQARQVLPRGAWRIAYASGWPDDERRALATR